MLRHWVGSTSRKVFKRRTRGADDLPLSSQRASQDEPDVSSDPLARLEAAAATNEESVFIEAYRTLNWAIEPASSYVRGVYLALASGAHLVARKLAAEGAERFPDHRELQKMATILAEPTVRRGTGAADPGLLANRDWLRSHREEYKGRWVALRAGQLLGVAESVEQLVAQVGTIANQKILITQVY